VKSAPASPFLVVQARVVFAPLKILLNGPATTAQTQAPPFGGGCLSQAT
jgi:hypothetical protein